MIRAKGFIMPQIEEFEKFESLDDGPFRMWIHQDTYVIAVKRGNEWKRIGEGHITHDEEDNHWFLESPPESLPKRSLEALEDLLNERYSDLQN